ncbi:universal stress protein [Aureibacillus halotolerans]|uniref:Nucleotide-binding universal stress UspA family protein n=1 Tax=Aureibacillus halotolerans TaxID=1508390 RepID=A0A4R6TVW8_9BACI|nr:universal stress protein [Aureibacillus halotolerans]TDQ37376.1 nucleotide-binding universal stress UspA family protein [Aureibacillus halotolerans]
MFQDILLAVDGSDHSVKAAEKAVELTGGNGLIEVVFVVDGSAPVDDDVNELKAGERKKIQRVEDVISQTALSYELVLLQGDPGPTLVDYANRRPYDCVVLGSRGLNTLKSMVLGSVSHKVASRVKWPVLIVK